MFDIKILKDNIEEVKSCLKKDGVINLMWTQQEEKVSRFLGKKVIVFEKFYNPYFEEGILVLLDYKKGLTILDILQPYIKTGSSSDLIAIKKLSNDLGEYMVWLSPECLYEYESRIKFDPTDEKERISKR